MAHRWILKPKFILIVPVLLLMLTAVACGSEESTPTPQPTPTPIDVAGIVQQAISAQSGGATAEDVASEIAKAMAAQPGVTSADVAEAIKSALAAQPGVNQEDVAMAIEKALQAQPGISPGRCPGGRRRGCCQSNPGASCHLRGGHWVRPDRVED